MTDSDEETRPGDASEPGRADLAVRRGFGCADSADCLFLEPGGLPRRFGAGESEPEFSVPGGAGVESVEVDLLAFPAPFARPRDTRRSSSSDESSSERLSSGLRSAGFFRSGVEGPASAPACSRSRGRGDAGRTVDTEDGVEPPLRVFWGPLGVAGASEEFSNAGDDALLETAESDDDRGYSPVAAAARRAGMPSSGETGRGTRAAALAAGVPLEARAIAASSSSSWSLSPLALLAVSEAVPAAWLPLPLVSEFFAGTDALALPRPLPRPRTLARGGAEALPRLVRGMLLVALSPLLPPAAGRAPAAAPGGDFGGSAR